MWRVSEGKNRPNQRTTPCDEGNHQAIRTSKKPNYFKAIHTHEGLVSMGLTELIAIEGTVTAKLYVVEMFQILAVKAIRRRDTANSRNGRTDTRLSFKREDQITFEQDYSCIHGAKGTFLVKRN